MKAHQFAYTADLCLLCKLNYRDQDDTSGAISSSIVLSHHQKRSKRAQKLTKAFPVSGSFFDRLSHIGGEPDLIFRMYSNDEYIITSTDLGAAIVITKFLSLDGYFAVIFPSCDISDALIRGKYHTLKERFYDDSTSNDCHTICKTFLTAIDAAILEGMDSDALYCHASTASRTIFAICSLFGISPALSGAQIDSFEFSPALFSFLTFLLCFTHLSFEDASLFSISLSTASGIGKLECSSTFIPSNAELACSPAAELLLSFTSGKNIENSHSFSRSTENGGITFSISANLKANDPSLVGLKVPDGIKDLI